MRPYDYEGLAVGPWREVTLPARTVRPPTIFGTAQVGRTLTADTSPITQWPGLTDAVFSYQWLRTGGAYGYAGNPRSHQLQLHPGALRRVPEDQGAGELQQ